ncbi:hypothetical protein CVT26_010079 [Gymnopilus dilepis]|uniref:Uncharacterized protein n=1 Tax=Gymnopilus dilepis TaxID=231916 RepID=A0A409VWN2_9AGAR|nr:hypothetical protein CVT26_010079 [Gymnopilus dilepis]
MLKAIMHVGPPNVGYNQQSADQNIHGRPTIRKNPHRKKTASCIMHHKHYNLDNDKAVRYNKQQRDSLQRAQVE